MKLSQITLVEGPFHLQIKQGSSLDTRDPAKIVKVFLEGSNVDSWVRNPGNLQRHSFPVDGRQKAILQINARISLLPTNLEQTQIPARGITCFYLLPRISLPFD
jgi:hypothetical protein